MKYKYVLSTSLLYIMCGLIFFKCTVVNASDTTKNYVDQEKTEISIILKKPILPGILPGEKGQSENMTVGVVSPQISQKNPKINYLPQTGFFNNNWILVGTGILFFLFLYPLLYNKREENS